MHCQPFLTGLAAILQGLGLNVINYTAELSNRKTVWAVYDCNKPKFKVYVILVSLSPNVTGLNVQKFSYKGICLAYSWKSNEISEFS